MSGIIAETTIEKTKFVLRKVSAEFIPQIVSIDQESAMSPWTRRQFESELKNSFSTFYVVLSNNLVKGFVVVWQAADEIQIANIAVAKESQRKGLAAWMLNTVFERAKANGITSAHLEVRQSNEKAMRFYKKFDFKTTGMRKNYYQAPQEDACLMSVQLA